MGRIPLNTMSFAIIQEFGAKIRKKPALRAGFLRFFVAALPSTSSGSSLQLDVVAVGVLEVVLQYVEFGHRLHLEFLSVFLHPFATNRKQAIYAEVGIDEGMHLQGQMVLVLVDHKVLEVVFDLVNEEDSGADLAFAGAHRAFLLHLHLGLGAYALTCDLNEAKLRRGKDGVFGTVVRHGLDQGIKQVLAVFGFVHVDKVDDDDAAHVAQTQLAGDFLGGFDVDFKGVSSGVFSLFRRWPLLTSMTCMASVCSMMR